MAMLTDPQSYNYSNRRIQCGNSNVQECSIQCVGTITSYLQAEGVRMLEDKIKFGLCGDIIILGLKD